MNVMTVLTLIVSLLSLGLSISQTVQVRRQTKKIKEINGGRKF